MSRDGTELARETAGFADCDPLADLGVDPALVRGVMISRTWEREALSLDTHSNTIAPQGCFLSPPQSSALPTGPQRVLFRIPSNDRLSFSYAGESVLPRGVQLFPDTKLWEVPVYVRESGGSLGELDVLKDGAPIGSVPISFDPCRFDGKPILEEQLRLTATNVDAGSQHIAVDTTAGVSCVHPDGTGSSAIP